MRTSFSKTLLLFITCLLSFTAYSQCSCTVLSPNTITTVGNYNCVFRGSSMTLTVSRPLGDSTLWYTINGTDTVKIGSGTSISYTLDTPRKFLARNVLTCYCTGPTQSTVYSSYVASASIRFDTTTANIGATFLLVNNDPVICNGTMTDVSVYAVGRTCSLTMTRDNTTNLTQGAATWTGVTNAYRIPLTNTTSSSQITNITFTPYLSGCLGTPQKTQVTVLPSPSASNSKCYAPAVPAEYGGAINAWIYRGGKLQLWAGKPSIAVDEREWYQVKGRDTIYKGGGDTLAIAPDTICTYIARNKNYCACGDSTHSIYYSQYALMATISAIQDTATKPTFDLTYSSTLCSGSPTSIYAYANAKDYAYNLADPVIAFYRDDTANVSGPVTGTFYQTSNVGVTLKNRTTVPQRVRFLLRSYPRYAGCWADDQIIYITVLPDTALPGDPCSVPARPKNWMFLYGDASTYAKGAHIQYSVDTTVTATEVLWYKVVGSDTSYIGSGYTINTIADTSCKYLVRNRNMCSCSGNSYYYSDYLQFASINVVTVSRFINWTPLNYVTTVASGTPFNIVPTADSAVLGFNLSRDNASISGSTNAATSTTYFSQGQLSAVLTNTTNMPQRVKYTIRANSNGIYYNSFTGYITVLPSSFTVSTPSHCVVPKQHPVVYQSKSVLAGATTIVNMGEPGTLGVQGAPLLNGPDTVDFIDWYKTRWPGDTTFLGSSVSPATGPVYAPIDTYSKILTVTRNVCRWSDSTIHEYKSGLYLNGMMTAGRLVLPTLSVTNYQPYVASGQATNIKLTPSSTSSGVGWYRTNITTVTGTTAGFKLGNNVTLYVNDTLINNSPTPQKVFFISYPINGAYGGNTKLDSVIVYPPCASWAGLTTAIHASKDSICMGDTTILTADSLPGPAGTSYLWSTGDTTRKIGRTVAGTYSVTVTSMAGGCTASASVTISGKVGPVLQAMNKVSYVGLSVTLSTSGANSYLWSTGDLSDHITVSSAGIYSVTGTGTNGCKTVVRDTVSMLPDSFTIHASLDTVFSGDTVILAADTIPGTTVEWFRGTCGALGNDYLGLGNVVSIRIDNTTDIFARYLTNAMLLDTVADTLNTNCASKRIFAKAILSALALSSGYDADWDTLNTGYSSQRMQITDNASATWKILSPDPDLTVGFYYTGPDGNNYTDATTYQGYGIQSSSAGFKILHNGKINFTSSVIPKQGDVIQIKKLSTDLYYFVNDRLLYHDQIKEYNSGILSLGYHHGLSYLPKQIFYPHQLIWPIKVTLGKGTSYHYDCNSDMNWQYTETYDENGMIVGAAKQFYDVLGRPTQSQVMNVDRDIIMASQTIYDQFGRKSITTLPAPIDNDQFCYKDGFVLAGAGQDYSLNPALWDGTHLNTPVALASGRTPSYGELAWYYSNYNTEEPSVAASGYPYSRTEYYNDPFNTVKRVSGPGEDFKMGSGHEVRSFVMPSLGELFYAYGTSENFCDNYYNSFNPYIFGSNTVFDPTQCDAAHTKHKVYKYISVDANGQEAITFRDIEGKTLATCLSADVVSSTDPLLQPVSFSLPVGGYQDIHIPKGVNQIKIADVASTGCGSLDSIQVYDINQNYVLLPVQRTYDQTGGYITFPGGGAQPGYYRLTSSPCTYTPNHNKERTVSYSLKYYNYALYYYDKAGRLIKSIPPEGVDYSNPNVTIAPFSSQYQSVATLCPSGQGNFTTACAVMTASYTPTPVHKTEKGDGYVILQRYDGTTSNQGSGNFRTLPPSGTVLTSLSSNLGTTSPVGTPNDLGYTPQTGPQPYTYRTTYLFNVDVFVDYNGVTSTVPIDQPYFTASIDVTYGDLALPQYSDWSSGQYYYPLAIDQTESQTCTGIRAVVTAVSKHVQDELGQTVGTDQYNLNPTDESTLVNQPLSINIYGQRVIFDNTPKNHTMAEVNSYNSLSQTHWKYTPDEKRTDYLYRKDGQVRFSQNAEQRKNFKFSYTNYDDAVRPIEVGEYNAALSGTDACTNINSQAAFYFTPLATDPLAPASTCTLSGTLKNISGHEDEPDPLEDSRCQEVSRILYDVPDASLSSYDTRLAGRTQRFTRGRTSRTTKYNLGSDASYAYGSWFSYDPLGRLEWEVEYIGDLGYRTIDYEYDLMGNVIQTIYNKYINTNTDVTATAEEFTHSYTYDAAKRLTNVTTRDEAGTVEQQAAYKYYLHGPLKRTELAGNLQGIDYTYTLGGALKAINAAAEGEAQMVTSTSNGFYTTRAMASPADPGLDGYSTGQHGTFMKDAFGIELDYHYHDYQRGGMYLRDGQELGFADQYGGLIRSVRWHTQGLGTMADAEYSPNSPQNFYGYTYDQKHNWLTGAQYGGFIPSCSVSYISQNMAMNTGYFPAYIISNNTYKEAGLTYDMNGNIQSLQRYDGSGTVIDNLTYHYDQTGNSMTAMKNRLLYVSDNSATHTAVTGEVQNQFSGNYTYNEIGQLTSELEADNAIDYNVLHKVSTVWNHDRTRKKVSYEYDANGHRVKKINYNNTALNDANNFTYYCQTLGGLVNRIMQRMPNYVGVGNSSIETPIYGLGRLGVRYSTYQQTASAASQVLSDPYQYELSDHLGNVHATIGRIPDPQNISYAKIKSKADYYPIGMPQPDRQLIGADRYRYGYQGQYAEKCDETGWNDFELRSYDSRIGRWLATDPVGQYWSPYIAMQNNWILYEDEDGGEDNPIVDGGALQQITVTAYGGDGFMPSSKPVELVGANASFGLTGVPTNAPTATPNGSIAATAAAMALTAIMLKEAWDRGSGPQTGVWYVTYTKTNMVNGNVYVGRAGRYGTPESVVRERDAEHNRDPKMKEYGPAVLSTALKGEFKRIAEFDPAYWATRGAEQLQIEMYEALGMSGNRINGISPKNPLLSKYLKAAKDYLGF